jgi:hypothetical protein
LVFSTSVAETFVLLKRFFKSPLKIKCIWEKHNFNCYHYSISTFKLIFANKCSRHIKI